jgi:hypothetical protein
MGTISGCLHLKVTLKKKMYLYMLTLLPTGVQTKYLKLLWLKNFYICHLCQWHRCSGAPWAANISAKFLKKIENGLNGILKGCGRNWFIKNINSKISCHCPFKLSLEIFTRIILIFEEQLCTVCSIWIFIFDSDEAQICSVHVNVNPPICTV